MDAIGALGMINGFYNFVNDPSQRQQDMQKELMEQQHIYNMQAMREQEAASLRMFEATGYGARVKQLKNAGLNPGLIYSMGAGGGGGVTGNITAPQVSGASAPNVSSAIQAKTGILGMSLEFAKLQSEIDVNKSIAEANRAEVAKKTKELPKIESETLGQDIQNDYNKIMLWTKEQGKFADVQKIKSESEIMYQKVLQEIENTRIKESEGKVAAGTVDARIQEWNEKVKNIIAETAVANSERKLNETEARKLKADILTMGEHVMIGKIKNEIDTERIQAELLMNLNNNSTKIQAETLNGIMGLIQKLIPGTTKLR